MNKPSSSKTAAWILCVLFVLIFAIVFSVPPSVSVQAQAPTPQAPVVTDTWAVQVSPGANPDQLAQQLGAVNLGQIGSLTGYYLFRIAGSDSQATAAADVFAASSQVLWSQQQVAHQLVARVPTDPLFPNQWHLNNTSGGVDIHVVPAWTAGYTGTGVNIAIVDDGLQHTHPDLSAQYDSAGSWDFNGNDADPAPVKSTDRHGTAVAGVAAANNDGASCGVGVAYDAGLSGIRLISDPVTDAQQASALTYAPNVNFIYNNSWGPLDNGLTLEGPGPLTLAALQNGVTTGRNGKGSIYVWSAGNGLQSNDNMNYDGYANSRFAIAVGAVDDRGWQASYSEPGAAMLVTAPSNAPSVAAPSPFSYAGPDIKTTDLMGAGGYNTASGTAGDCVTGGFGGTSSSAAMVSGVAALMLQANPNLGWRDVQEILARTAVKNDPTNQDWSPEYGMNINSWATNSAGFHINHKYGFGLVDAAAAVTMASTWSNLPAEVSYSSGLIAVNTPIPDYGTPAGNGGVIQTFVVTQDIRLEHIEVVFNATHTYRGDLEVVLTSPSGTQSVLATPRLNDSAHNYVDWKFMTVRDWGESSVGTWTIQVRDRSGGTGTGSFDSWQLNLYGTPSTAVTISGNTGVGGVILSYTDSTLKTVTSLGNGDYSISVPGGWGGTVTPVSSCYTFTPATKTYSILISDQTAQNYTYTLTGNPTCQIRSISGVVTSALGLPIAGALVKTNLGYIATTAADGSYTLSGLLPAATLTVTAGMAEYITGSQNVTLPPDATGANFVLMPSKANVDITIGGNLKGSYIIPVGGRIGGIYPGVNDGPVQVVSINAVPIIASERAYRGANYTDWNEMMGFPANQLTTEYWFPLYDTTGIAQTFITVGNADPSESAEVSIYIAGQLMGSYTIPVGGRIGGIYPGVNNGPVRVVSTNLKKIIASERAYRGANYTDWNEMMGFPANQLTTEYWFPLHDTTGIAQTFITVGNADPSESAEVSIYIAGQLMGSYTIPVGGRIGGIYPGVNNGPVRVVSTNLKKIIASERAYRGANYTDWNEMMGFPANQLTTEYWFPLHDTTGIAQTFITVGNADPSESAEVSIYIAGQLMGSYTIPVGGRIGGIYPGINNGPVRVVSTNLKMIIASERAYRGANYTDWNEMMGFPANQLTTEYWFPLHDTTGIAQTFITVGNAQ